MNNKKLKLKIIAKCKTKILLVKTQKNMKD